MELLIKEVLKRKGISVKELSQLLGVTRDACYKYINGNPTINVLDRIAKVLDVDVRSLINGRDGKEFRASNDIMGRWNMCMVVCMPLSDVVISFLITWLP